MVGLRSGCPTPAEYSSTVERSEQHMALRKSIEALPAGSKVLGRMVSSVISESVAVPGVGAIKSGDETNRGLPAKDVACPRSVEVLVANLTDRFIQDPGFNVRLTRSCAAGPVYLHHRKRCLVGEVEPLATEVGAVGELRKVQVGVDHVIYI